MDLRDIYAALRTRWWLPVLGLIVASSAALGLSLAQTPLYTASTQLFVSTTEQTSTSDVLQGSQFSEQRVTSYARLITGQEIASRLIDHLELRLSAEELSKELSATAVQNTVLIDVTVTDPSPRQAQRIAAALGSEFTDFAAQLERSDANGVSPVKVTVTQRPSVPSEPSSPKSVRNSILGGIVGLLVGAGLAVARARLDRSVKDSDVATELANAPVIGTILRDEALLRRHTIDRGTASRTAEDYRQLRTNLQFLNVDQPPKVIMVSSAVPSEGKTTVVVNLALALADAGRKVVIVESDLRRPKVSRYLGIVGEVGLTNILAGTANIDEVLQSYREGMAVIASGPTPPNPGELLGSSAMTALLEKLRTEYDFILVDAPPLLPVADASTLAPAMDGVLLSIRYGHTQKDQLRQAAATLEGVKAKLLGVILNIVPPKAEGASAYGYGYGYGYDGKHSQLGPPTADRR